VAPAERYGSGMGAAGWWQDPDPGGV